MGPHRIKGNFSSADDDFSSLEDAERNSQVMNESMGSRLIKDNKNLSLIEPRHDTEDEDSFVINTESNL